MIDPIPAVLRVLKNNSTVNTLTASRLYRDELPSATGMPRTAVVVKAAGGPGGGAYLEYARVRVDVDCWASTPGDAVRLHLAVRTALKHMPRQVVDGVLLHSVEVSSDGISARDPDTDWPVTVSSYLVAVAEVAAA